jgi:hypothetical protein
MASFAANSVQFRANGTKTGKGALNGRKWSAEPNIDRVKRLSQWSEPIWAARGNGEAPSTNCSLP